MSQFIDKLKQASQAEPKPMGFRAARSASGKPRMLLIASLARAKIDKLTERVAGADAGLVPVSEPSLGAKAMEQLTRLVPDIPWGGWLGGIGEGEVGKLAGYDFLVFPAATTSLVLINNKTGRILEVKPSLAEGLLRAVDELPLDAVLAVGEENILTWHYLMFLQRCADLFTKPLLAVIPATVSASELQILWEAGVDGVVVNISAELVVGRLGELRQEIDKLTFPSPRKRRKVEALLPHIPVSQEVDREFEEE
ncbi:MAG: hypothetical protein E3J67_00355 [Dehalococcoidia bacterium]|nr:MAG: hypothetical protein E3J67_00355 [Dehalococcoidia bacterium]